jgi:hypothetical protein
VDKERDYIVLPGGHSSLVVARPFFPGEQVARHAHVRTPTP